MNAQRVLLRVFCSKRSSPHVIATIVQDEVGLLLRYKSAVRRDLTGNDADDFETVAGEGRPGDEIGAVYCSSCRKRYFLPVEQAFAGVAAGKRAFKVTGRGELLKPHGV